MPKEKQKKVGLKYEFCVLLDKAKQSQLVQNNKELRGFKNKRTPTAVHKVLAVLKTSKRKTVARGSSVNTKTRIMH